MRRAVLCVALLSACGVSGCRRLFVRSETHLLPEGYQGPVVIVFGDPDGQELKRDSKGAYVFQIPATGYLRFRDDPPSPKWFESVTSITSDRTALEQRSAETVVQGPYRFSAKSMEVQERSMGRR
jgi:hypothetical protein